MKITWKKLYKSNGKLKELELIKINNREPLKGINLKKIKSKLKYKI